MAPATITPTMASSTTASTTKHTPVMPVMPKSTHRPDFFQALGRIMELRKQYLANRHLFVKGEEMHDILKPLGARDEDFELMRDVSNHLGKDPTLPYREITQGRYIFDYDERSIYRTEKQPFILSAKEGFKRHDSDSYREFPEIKDDLQQNSVLQALLLFKTLLMEGVESLPRPHQDYTSDKWVCTLFNVRTFTSNETLGEPALEGVHSDGVDHTMVTLLGHENMTDESAMTFIHDMRERTGIRIEETNGSLVRGVAQHWDFLDTIMIIDNERFHSLTPVWRVDESCRATRDVLIFFSRKPALEKHASYGVDSMVPHKSLPMRMPLYTPFG